jgi:hypothetical protein
MILNRYKANSTNIVSRIQNFNIVQTFDNVSAGVFEFYFDKPHMLTDGSMINISSPENYDPKKGLYPNILKGNAIIRLRPQVRIGITATNKYKWRYADNSNDWVLMGGGGSLQGTIDIPIIGGMVEQEFVSYEDSLSQPGIGQPFTIQIGSSNGMIAVKEQHSSVWQELINPSDIPNCGIWSDHSVVSSIVINDTYLRVNRFDLFHRVPIRDRGYDDCGKYYFFTNYGLDTTTNLWFDHLYSSPCECQDICVKIDNPSWTEIIGGLLHDNGGTADCSVDPPQPNPDGIYGGGALQDKPVAQAECENVSIQVYKHCDDLYEPICANRDNILKPGSSNVNYSFSIIDNIDYTMVKEIRKCLPLNCLKFWRDVTGFQCEIGLDMNFNTDLGRNDKWNTNFIEDEKKKTINQILDNERVRFEPYWKNGDDDFTPINHIKFKLIFLDEENKPDTWTDEKTPIPEDPTCWKSLGFIDDDVKYQKMKLKKCFLRLSYYDNNNPSQYLLEHYNTVFTDINMMFSKYIYGINSLSGFNYNTIPISKFKDPYTGEDTEGFRTEFDVYNPLIKNVELTPHPDDDEAYRKDGPFVMNYSNTSDGYYIYLYDPAVDSKCSQVNGYWDQIPNKLFMKLEFNNAKTGKRHLFFKGKNKSGYDMDQVFFGEEAIWTYIWVEYNKKLNKYIWYFDPENPNVEQDEKCKDQVNVKFWEAYVK